MSLGRHGTPESLAAYRDFLDQIAGVNVVVSIPGKWATITELIEAYLIYAKQRYMRDDGLSSEYEGMVHALGALEYLGSTTADKFTPKVLSGVRSTLARMGYRRTTVNHMLSRIKKFFRWCCESELCPGELYHQLIAVRGLVKGENSCVEPEPVKPAPLASINGILPYLSKTVSAMVRVQYRCGMRPAEVCGMGPAFIDDSGPTWFYYPGKHKTQWRGATAIRGVPPSAQAILKPFLKSEPYYFRTHKGGSKYTSGGYRQALERAFAKTVDLEAFRPNQLRHAIATHIAQKFGHRAAQVWCGHDQPNTTALYIEKQTSELAQISKQLEMDWNNTA